MKATLAPLNIGCWNDAW